MNGKCILKCIVQNIIIEFTIKNTDEGQEFTFLKALLEVFVTMIKYLNKTTEKIYFGFIAFKPIAKQSTMLKGMVEVTSYGR